MVLAEYFQPFKEADIDTLVLGCTHYPLIRDDIAASLRSLIPGGGGVAIVDSARTTAERTKALLADAGALSRGSPNGAGGRGSCRIHLTDFTETFRRIGERIVGSSRFEPRMVTLTYDRGRVSYS
jgi:glutamate racemase